MPRTLYHLLADGVLVTHVAFVGFVVIGLALILLGGLRRWSWVRNRWFRRTHLAAIGLVVVQAWLGIICPLTNLEMFLREKAGDATYQDTFIAHWLHRQFCQSEIEDLQRTVLVHHDVGRLPVAVY